MKKIVVLSLTALLLITAATCAGCTLSETMYDPIVGAWELTSPTEEGLNHTSGLKSYLLILWNNNGYEAILNPCTYTEINISDETVVRNYIKWKAVSTDVYNIYNDSDDDNTSDLLYCAEINPQTLTMETPFGTYRRIFTSTDTTLVW